MGAERRRYVRLTRPLDGGWHGRSGSAACRIADIGWGGCFIDSRTSPPMNEATVISVGDADGSIKIAGRVVHVERGVGFSVQFEPLTNQQVVALTRLLGDPPEDALAPAAAQIQRKDRR
jgi:hypothetical protein